MPVLFRFLDNPNAAPPLTVEYIRGPTNGPMVPVSPATLPYALDTTIQASQFWVLNGDGSVTCQADGDGDYDITYNANFVNAAFTGGGNRIDCNLTVNGVVVPGSLRICQVGGFLQAAGVMLGKLRVFGIVAGDVIAIRTSKLFGPSTSVVGSLSGGLLRMERVG
jgi:hypothetical protein